jgi:hypothetical protein
MIADLMVERINDRNSSILWKITFIILVNIRTPVLFLMLFIGNQNFNLFQLGFMLFFVAFGASEKLYKTFSILLPVFISYFILTQYCWSLVQDSPPSFLIDFVEEKYNRRTDFLFLIDGWEAPSDKT